MVSLLLVVFLVEAAVRLVNAVGATTINNLLWTLLNVLPISTSKTASEQRKVQSEYLKVRRDLNATSSQDEFAKWAKLRRQHDKLLEQLETKKKSMETSRAKFDNYLTGARILVTRAPQYLLPFWYAKEPMFWLPYGWFPYWAEWIISFPRAPLGSVSVASWQLACTGFVGLIADLIAGAVGLVLSARAGNTKTKEMPMKGAVGTAAGSAQEKKSN
jgi:hypothetical protein